MLLKSIYIAKPPQIWGGFAKLLGFMYCYIGGVGTHEARFYWIEDSISFIIKAYFFQLR